MLFFYEAVKKRNDLKVRRWSKAEILVVITAAAAAQNSFICLMFV